ncbi:hypothetical protein XENOCAPTIV_014886 [Xenoophorus captivus]|uniref:Secreted protein n=1 Tax=Xenoophorus captivus TaxID=1517983 RepID=A0ABV0S906_9TELE
MCVWCAHKCWCTIRPCFSSLFLHYFSASPAMLHRVCDTHSSAFSHMKACVTAAEIPECSSEQGRGGRRGEVKEGRRAKRGSDRAIVAGILQGLPEQPTLKALFPSQP